MKRRTFLAMSAAAITAMTSTDMSAQSAPTGGKMYGLIGKVTLVPGQRDAFAALLMNGVDAMPGCLSYVIATDPADDNALWITEVWDSQASHKASLQLPSVQNAIAKGRPMIAGFSNRVETTPLGGFGLHKG